MADTTPNTKPTNEAGFAVKTNATTTPAATAAAANLRQGAQAMQQGGHAASDVMRRAADMSAEATQRGTEAGTEAALRAGEAARETLRRTAEALAESQREFAENAAKQFEEVSRKMAEATHGTSDNLRALMVLPNASAGGLHDLHQSMTGLVEGVVRTNLRAAQELFQHANPAALIELQQRFVREYLDTLMQGTATLVRATRRAADETLRPIEQQIETQKAANQGGRFSQAAE